MEDKDIVKALECEIECNKGLKKHCIGCLLQKHYPYCEEKVIEYALDLINRLQEEKEALINGQETLQKHIADLQAENERLKNAYKQVAWERDIFAEDMKQEIKKDCSYLMLDIKTIKAEAYKEFAERLKENFEPLNSPLINNRIDNLLNELVGE